MHTLLNHMLCCVTFAAYEFLISLRIYSTPKLSKYVILSPLTYKAI